MDKLLKSDVNFQRVRDGRNALPFYFDLDLSTARSVAAGTHFNANVAGDSFYADANPIDGNCIVHFQDTNLDRAAVPFYVSPGFIANVPFTQLLIENAAQPGKKIRITYGVDIDFQPGSVAQIAVSNIGGYTAVRPEAQTGFFSDSSNLVANTPLTVFTPAANANGAILLSATIAEAGAAPLGVQAFIAKAAVPTSITDGAILLASNLAANTATNYISANLSGAQYISPGHGLYFICPTATVSTALSLRSARYRLL